MRGAFWGSPQLALVSRVGGEAGSREAHDEADLLVVIVHVGWGQADEEGVAAALSVEEELHATPLHVVGYVTFNLESVV